MADAIARWTTAAEPLRLLDFRNEHVQPCGQRLAELLRRYPRAEVWSASSEGGASSCGSNVLQGNIAQNTTLAKQWAATVGGGFDVVIDQNASIGRLKVAWQAMLRPGGRYVLEHVKDGPIVDAMLDYQEWLIIRATSCQQGILVFGRVPRKCVPASHGSWMRTRKNAAQEVVYHPPPGLQYVVLLPRTYVLKRTVDRFYGPRVEALWDSARRKQTGSLLAPVTTGEDACISDFNRTAHKVVESVKLSAALMKRWEIQKKTKGGSLATDKVWRHYYQVLYGATLCSKRRAEDALNLGDVQWRKPSKMLEIGLGCDMNYGPGMSVPLWKALFPEAERWEGEIDGKCVSESRKKGKLNDVAGVVVGDQANRITLNSWKAQTSGHFDIIIDDGGHTNTMIMVTFEQLWPELNAGGIYFIEDMALGRTAMYDSTNGAAVAADFVQNLGMRVVLGKSRREAHASIPDVSPNSTFSKSGAPGTRRTLDHRLVNISPPAVAAATSYVFVSLEACAIGKSSPISP